MNQDVYPSNLYERLKETFLSSAQKSQSGNLFHQIKKPLILLGVFASIGAFGTYNAFSILSQVASAKDNTLKTSQTNIISEKTAISTIYVDISGSVMKPNTYELTEGTRLFELIEAAGGLSPEVDKGFVSRNYNFSVILHDQQKIHIPSVFEVRDGFFTENKKIVRLPSQATSIDMIADSTTSANETGKISINNAPTSLLETLEGVGEVTAKRIVSNRPYESLEDLVSKDVIKSSLFEKLEAQLAL